MVDSAPSSLDMFTYCFLLSLVASASGASNMSANGILSSFIASGSLLSTILDYFLSHVAGDSSLFIVFGHFVSLILVVVFFLLFLVIFDF